MEDGSKFTKLPAIWKCGMRVVEKLLEIVSEVYLPAIDALALPINADNVSV
jgi:hypothetical protein